MGKQIIVNGLIILSSHFETIVICISRPRNHSLTYREKNCRRGINLENVKGFCSQGVPTQNFMCNRKFVIAYYKTNNQNLLHSQ
jgi:hypothetical protein